MLITWLRLLLPTKGLIAYSHRCTFVINTSFVVGAKRFTICLVMLILKLTSWNTINVPCSWTTVVDGLTPERMRALFVTAIYYLRLHSKYVRLFIFLFLWLSFLLFLRFELYDLKLLMTYYLVKFEYHQCRVVSSLVTDN